MQSAPTRDPARCSAHDRGRGPGAPARARRRAPRVRRAGRPARLRRRRPGEGRRPPHLLEYPPRAGHGVHGRRLRPHDRRRRRVYGRARPGLLNALAGVGDRLRLLVARAVHRWTDPVGGHRPRPGHAARDPRPIADPRSAHQVVGPGRAARPRCRRWCTRPCASSAAAGPQPVGLEVPPDVLQARRGRGARSDPVDRDEPLLPDPELVRQAAELLARAERPAAVRRRRRGRRWSQRGAARAWPSASRRRWS